MKNKTFNSIVIIVSACIFLSFFLFTKGLNSLINELKTLNTSWILLSVLLMLLFWVFETLTLYVITKTFHKTSNLLINDAFWWKFSNSISIFLYASLVFFISLNLFNTLKINISMPLVSL